MHDSAQYPEILTEIADCIRRRLSLNLPPDQADPMALATVEDIRARFGGALIYIPVGAAFDRAQRNQAIVAEFDGSNHAALARRHRLTVGSIYDIIGRNKKIPN